MPNKNTRFRTFKKGAASFYIVAFSTLILVIIATSFATVILSEISRSENDDLSQSAYDSALAGIEDAKVAFSNYKRCVEAGVTSGTRPTGSGTNVTCSDIVWWMQHPDCDMVGHILGKISKNLSNTEVVVGATYTTSAGSEESVMNQAYTCTKIDTNLADYRATLSSDKMAQVIRAGVGDGETNKVNRIKISWYTVKHNNAGFLRYSNFSDTSNKVTFGALSAGDVAVPPTLEVQLVQTGTSFNMDQFDLTGPGNRTNRATLYLVPTDIPVSTESNNYIGVWNSSKNYVSAGQVTKTNDHRVSNKPFAVYCNKNTGDEFYCSVEIELPEVINGGDRRNDTFMIGVALPYQKPDTDFSLELICNGNNNCGGNIADSIGGDSLIELQNTQISIDSTGRANDLYRRVETRFETSDSPFGFGSPYYALQILGSGKTEKTMKVKHEQKPSQNPSGFYF